MKLTLDALVASLIGREAKANHPITCLNPTETFIITEAKVENGAIVVRGTDTCWWGEGAVDLLP